VNELTIFRYYILSGDTLMHIEKAICASKIDLQNYIIKQKFMAIE